MGRAVLEIAGDTGPLLRALGQIPGRVKKAADAIRGEFRKAMEESTDGAEKAAVAHQRAAAAMRAASKAAGKAASDEQKAQTRIAQQESTYRTSAVRREADETVRQERRKTAATQTEARKRERVAAREMSERRRMLGNAGRAVLEGGGQIATRVHSQVQTAREQRAGTETSLNDSFVQAVRQGLNEDEAGRLRARVYQFARDRSIPEEQIAQAIGTAQTQFNVIGGAKDSEGRQTAAARAAALDNILEVVALGRTTGNAPAETANFFGALVDSGLSTSDALVSTRQAIASGMEGSVSLGQLAGQGLGSLRQSIAGATVGLTGDARSRAVQQQTARFAANLQLQAGVGARVGVSGNRLTGLETYLQNESATTVLYNRLNERFRGNREAQGAIAGMFEVGPGGRASVRQDFRDPTRFGAEMTGLFRGDVAGFRNMMGAHGAWSAAAGGKNQAMNAPLVAGLANIMSLGPEALAKRDKIMRADLTPEQLATMGGIRRGEQNTELIRDQQGGRDALTDNSSLMNVISNRVASWATANPVLSTVSQIAGGGVLARVLGSVGGMISGAVAPAAAGGAGAAGVAGTAASGGLAVIGAKLVASALAGAAVGDLAMRGSSKLAGERADLTRETSIFGGGLRLVAKEITDAIRDGFTQARVVAEVTPRAAAHATTEAGLAAGSRPTTSR